VKQNLELLVALICVVLLTTAYLLVASDGAPRPSSLLGHGIGVIGFLLMLSAETLYSWRKTRRHGRWGQTRTWLSAHIFAGIVGPYMVLLHTGFRFAGLAGIAFWMTVVVVCSGFVGRYIYTAIPHTSTGAEMEAAHLQAVIGEAEATLQAWLSDHAPRFRALVEQVVASPVASGSGISGLLSGAAADRRYRERWQRAVHGLDAPLRQQASELRLLLERYRALQRQAATLSTARRAMAIWHALHVPLGVALFVTAILHAVVALYYS
jgi:hypothetical protein